MGYQFRRQRPVLNYIADFMCKELKLIIEVDGITHPFEEVRQRDKVRQRELEQAGFVLIRFDNEEVLNDIDFVFKEIDNWIENHEKKIPPLYPPPKRSGKLTGFT